MPSNGLLYLLFLSVLLQDSMGTRLLKFTNVKCMDLPTSRGLTKYEYCHLKVVRRNQVELSLKNHMTVEKFALDFRKISMPVPARTYRLDFTFYAYGIARTLTQVFFEKIE
ncbi:GM16195 [Drosophila sechellia]|uniref:GM16195 n=1 Tax=Drosophila sechellia TaxID=7238 RepID=B4INE3_DROSE|nr:GM16195 [Drosophila sechellia]